MTRLSKLTTILGVLIVWARLAQIEAFWHWLKSMVRYHLDKHGFILAVIGILWTLSFVGIFLFVVMGFICDSKWAHNLRVKAHKLRRRVRRWRLRTRFKERR